MPLKMISSLTAALTGWSRAGLKIHQLIAMHMQMRVTLCILKINSQIHRYTDEGARGSPIKTS